MSSYNLVQIIKKLQMNPNAPEINLEKGTNLLMIRPNHTISWAMEGHNGFIFKGLLGWFLNCDDDSAFLHYDSKFVEDFAVESLVNAHKLFKSIDRSWMLPERPTKFLFANFVKCLEVMKKKRGVCLGSYTPENILEVAKVLNMSTEQIAAWCGMEKCFAYTIQGDQFMVETRSDPQLNVNYTQGIMRWFEK
jgi:hypothetical protein